MKAKLLQLKQNWRDTLAMVFLSLVGIWIVFALLFQLTMVGIHIAGKTELETDIAGHLGQRAIVDFSNKIYNHIIENNLLD